MGSGGGGGGSGIPIIRAHTHTHTRVHTQASGGVCKMKSLDDKIQDLFW